MGLKKTWAPSCCGSSYSPSKNKCLSPFLCKTSYAWGQRQKFLTQRHVPGACYKSNFGLGSFTAQPHNPVKWFYHLHFTDKKRSFNVSSGNCPKLDNEKFWAYIMLFNASLVVHHWIWKTPNQTVIWPQDPNVTNRVTHLNIYRKTQIVQVHLYTAGECTMAQKLQVTASMGVRQHLIFIDVYLPS